MNDKSPKEDELAKPTITVESDGKVVLEVKMDKENSDWIRAARKNSSNNCTTK